MLRTVALCVARSFLVALVLCSAGMHLGAVQARGWFEIYTDPVVAVTDLPPQGQRTYRLIFKGGPFPHEKDGMVFSNRGRQLPIKRRGYYREYTVRTPGVRDRGARRIVCGGYRVRMPDACWYTSDHYASFKRIV